MGTPAARRTVCAATIGAVTRSGGAAKLAVEKIRMQTTSVDSFSEGSKADDERGMVTP
jgi:hypothetical protein